jgi:hypothetical protein
MLHHSLKLALPLLQSAEARVGRGVLAEQTRVVCCRLLLSVNLRDLPLYHRQLLSDASQLLFHGAAAGFTRQIHKNFSCSVNRLGRVTFSTILSPCRYRTWDDFPMASTILKVIF